MEVIKKTLDKGVSDVNIYEEMKRFLFCFLMCLLTVIFMSSKATAAQLNAEDIKKYVSMTLERKLENSGYSKAQVEVTHLPFKYLTLPEGKITYKLSANSDRVTSRNYQKLEIFVNGNSNKIIGVPVVIKAYKKVLIARNPIKRDVSISPHLVEIKEIDTAGLINEPVEPISLSRHLISTKYFFAGEVLDKRFVKERPDVVMNAPVSVIFKDNKGIAITIEATAMKEGYIGDTISAQNRSMKKVYTGQVISENKILVKI